MTLEPILKTKLFIPPLRQGIISRPRLIEFINANISKKLFFVSASAGFGKSTLLAEWAAQSDYPVCWISLGPSEDDLTNLLSYLIASVQTIWEGLGEAILNALRSPGSPPVDYLLKSWINELWEYSTEFVLILDDFHHINSQEATELICYLTEHQPPQMHLLIASRSDLPAKCSRQRALNELKQLDTVDLRFTQAESIAYLKSQLGERITEQEARILSEHTEGWIVGLHMAALSMESGEDVSKYVRQFSANDRYIAEYLMDEILLRQPAEIQNFLLITSVLDKFTAPLCNHLADIDNSQEIIDTLVRTGMFIIPLDTTRTWHRYHQLFAELLQSRPSTSEQFTAESLQRKASEWFAAEGMLEESIAHAFAAGDYHLVIRLIEDSLNQILAEGMFRNYLTWTDRIPAKLLAEKPRLEIVKVFMLHEMGLLDERDRKMEQVEKLLGPVPTDFQQCSPEELINHGIFASIKAIIYASSDFLIKETYEFAHLAEQILPDEYTFWRTLALGAIPFLNRALGNYTSSLKENTKILGMVIDNGFLFQAFIIYTSAIKSYIETGQLKRALVTCQKAIDLDNQYDASLPFAKYVYLLMGELLYQTGQTLAAEEYIEIGLEYVVRHGEIYSIIDVYSTLIRIQIANGDGDQALALIRELKSVMSELPFSENSVKVVNGWEAYTNILVGHGSRAAHWVETPGFNHLDDNYLFDLGEHSYVGIYRVSQTPIRFYKDFLQLTTARLSLCQGNLQEGLAIIDDLLFSIAQSEGKQYQLEALIVKARLLNEMQRKEEAVTVLQESIQIAAKEGYVQIFINEGERIKPLLKAVKGLGTDDIEEQVFILRLLESIQVNKRRKTVRLDDPLVELSPREIEVLVSLSSGVSYARAAEDLSISRNTLKTHTKRIYQKLGVSGLLQALNKAKQMNLIQ